MEKTKRDSEPEDESQQQHSLLSSRGNPPASTGTARAIQTDPAPCAPMPQSPGNIPPINMSSLMTDFQKLEPLNGRNKYLDTGRAYSLEINRLSLLINQMFLVPLAVRSVNMSQQEQPDWSEDTAKTKTLSRQTRGQRSPTGRLFALKT